MSPKPEAFLTTDLLLMPSAIHTVGLGITDPAPANSRVDVLRFAQVSQVLEQQLRQKLEACTLDYSSIDLECVLCI